MARIRSSKPEWWRKPKWCALQRDVRFTYKGIWEVMCDDYGRFLADVRIIKGDVWPFDDDITFKKIESWLGILERVPVTVDDRGDRAPAVVFYVSEGIRYGFLPGFVKHQKISHKTDSKFPAPPEDYRLHSGKFPENGRKNSPTSGSGADRDLERELDSGAEGPVALLGIADEIDPVVRDEDRAAPPAPLVELPPEADRFLDQFYSLSTDKRKLDARRQLYDSLDPRLRGARLRKGVHVKARSVEHLAQKCREVCEDPPRNPDAAVVILLEKLQDPAPGPTPAEQHKADESTRVAEEDAYHRAAKSAGVIWAREQPEAYAPILAAVNREFPDAESNAFMRMSRDSALVQRCAKAAGFPSFDTWRSQRQAGAA